MTYERKPILGYPGYEIDTDGTVWSCLNFHGGFSNKWHKIKPTVTHEYLKIGFRASGKRMSGLVHRLLAQAFIPNPRNKPYVLHRDGNPLHNCIPQKHCGCGGNLYWGTQKENAMDSIRHGTHWASKSKGIKKSHGYNIGILSPNAKFTEKQIRVIKWALHYGASPTYLARAFKVSPGLIQHIKQGKSWNHITIS